MNAVEALGRFSFLRDMSDGSRHALRTQGIVTMVAPHTSLLRKGDEVGGVFLVCHGAIRVFYVDSRGRQGTLYRVGAGQACFFSLECTLRGGPYPAWVESEEQPTQFVKIPAHLFKQAYAEEPALRQFTYDALSARVLSLMAVIEQSASLAVEQRVAALLLSLCDSEGRVTCSQARLAEHLGSVREVVVRTLRTFREQGLVSTRRGAMQVEDARRLKDLAGL